MKKMIRLSEVNFETNLKIDDILKIVDMYIKEKGEPYEIDETIIYDPEETRITNGPVWYVDVILPETKKRFPDAYDTLAISDRDGRLAFVMNDHGRIVETY